MHLTRVGPDGSSYSKPRFVVALNERLKSQADLSFLEEDGFAHLETIKFPEDSFPGLKGDMLLVEAEDSAQLQALTQDPRVQYVEFDQEFELQPDAQEISAEQAPESMLDTEPSRKRKPNDLKSRQWGLDSNRNWDIDAPEAWSRTVGRRDGGPIIAVIDTGVDTSHPDLRANLWVNSGEIPGNGRDDDGNGVVDDVHGFDAYNRDGEPEDPNGHGTHCAGIIGATGNNGQGMTGVNWQTRIMPIKIFDNNREKPRTSVSAMLRGISYAGRNGARITSNSWGGPTRRRSVRNAFEGSAAFHLMGAGNDEQNNDKKPFYPASYRLNNALSVAAITSRGRLSGFSNYGKTSVDLAAPGSQIYSTLPNGRYGNRSGTSMATPFVTGVAGLLVSATPRLSNSQIKSLIVRGVKPNSNLTEKTVTGGVVNAKNSLDLLFASKSTEKASSS